VSRFEWKSGYRAAVSAEIAGTRLAELAEQNGGDITPPLVVEDARPEGAVLHDAFEWDDTTAGEQWRLEQARALVRNVIVVHVEEDGRERPCRGYLNVDMPDEGRCYVSTARIVEEPALLEQVREDALRGLESWKARYKSINGLEAVYAAIEAALAAARTPRKRKAKDGKLQPTA
jgi:hypothetical protein